MMMELCQQCIEYLYGLSPLKDSQPPDSGVMPIMTYGGFKRMTGFCKTHVPKDIEKALEGIKDNDEAVKAFGIDLGTRMCKRILESGTPGLHMYTLNTERSSVAILENLGLINKTQVGCGFDLGAIPVNHGIPDIRNPCIEASSSGNWRLLQGVGLPSRPDTDCSAACLNASVQGIITTDRQYSHTQSAAVFIPILAGAHVLHYPSAVLVTLGMFIELLQHSCCSNSSALQSPSSRCWCSSPCVLCTSIPKAKWASCISPSAHPTDIFDWSLTLVIFLTTQLTLGLLV